MDYICMIEKWDYYLPKIMVVTFSSDTWSRPLLMSLFNRFSLYLRGRFQPLPTSESDTSLF